MVSRKDLSLAKLILTDYLMEKCSAEVISKELNLSLMSDFLTKKAPGSVMMMALSLEWMRVF